MLPPTSDKSDVKAERDALLKEIAQIETWWREPRWDDTKRAYTGEPVVVNNVFSC